LIMLYSVVQLTVALAAPTHRRLSYAGIVNYNPGSQVTDHANIDLDQAALESALSVLPTGYATAKRIYETGAHSKPTAECTLATPATLGQAVARRAVVTFTTNNGDVTSGSAYTTYTASDTAVSFTYAVSESRVQPPSTACYVGGLPAASQVTAGCIAGSQGNQSTLTIGGVSYTATCTNRGKRTLQDFSTKAQQVMHDCPRDGTVDYDNGCPYNSYLPYYRYYGVYDYANQIVLAALDGTSTSGFTNGAMDLASSTDAARKEVIKKGTSYMNAWMYAIREFEDAIDDCSGGDLTSNALSSGPVHAWDEGVAFYTGSILTFDDLLAGNLPALDGVGNMPYTLANKRCKNFKTCGPDGNSRIGEAKANMELFELFRNGQYQLLAGECARVVPIKDEIVTRMTVPLVQGTLRYAYKMAALSGSDKEKAEGAIFAAAVLPQLHECDPVAATTVYNEMRLGSDNAVDFTAVKAAFEGCYASMGVTCADVGGLWNEASDAYYSNADFDASPCADASTSTVKIETVIAALAAIVIFLACCMIVACLLCREKKGKPVFQPAESPSKAAGSA